MASVQAEVVAELLKMLDQLKVLDVKTVLQDYGDHVNSEYCYDQQGHGVALVLVKGGIYEVYGMEHLRRCLDWRKYEGVQVAQEFDCYQVHGHF